MAAHADEGMRADVHELVHQGVRADPGALAHLDLRTDHGERPHRHAVGEARARLDERRAVDLRRHHALRLVQRIDASATTSPSTRATQANLPMPRIMRSSVTSISSRLPGPTGFLTRAL